MRLNRISVLAAPTAILILFGSALVGKDALAFRDVGHFYTPLYDYVASRTHQSWLPLWNPLDATGIPLLGETTTAVLYPPRQLIFALPVPTDVAMSIYVVSHLILASFFAVLAARWAGASRPAARIAGVIYPLSGSVLFLYTNAPFLVGASWLPLAIASLTTMNRMSVLNRTMIAGTAMAMMVTGGDPQTALHTMLVAVAFWIARRLRLEPNKVGVKSFARTLLRKEFWRIPLPNWRGTSHSVRGGTAMQLPLGAIIASGLLAGILAAPQLAASIAWSSQSERVVEQRNSHESGTPIGHRWRNESYQFSLPPWHAAEILTPRALGSLFPINARISSLIPGDGRMWTPTIYLGAVAAWMILSRLLFFGRRPISGNAWMWLAATSLCLSLGHFGLVWMLQQFPGTLPHTDSATGGPYWLLYHFLPGYDAFRYPAKWLPVFSLALSIAVSLWIDQHHVSDRSTTRHSLACYLGIILLAVTGLAAWRYRVTVDPFATADEYWGPLDVSLATKQIAFSIGHSLIALLAIFAASQMRMKRVTFIHVLLIITTLDLSATAYPNIAKVLRSDKAKIVKSVDQTREDEPRHRWMRTQSGGGWPSAWSQSNDPERLTEILASEQISWFGRWHLQDRQAVFNSMVSIRSRAMAEFWVASNRVTQSMNANEREQFWRRVRTWLQIDGVLHASNFTKRSRSDDHDFVVVDVTKRIERTPANQFQFCTNWSVCDRSDSFDDLLRDVHQSEGKPTHLILTRNPLSIEPAKAANSKALMEVRDEAAESTIVRVRNEADGVLVRSVFQDGSWQAEIREHDSDTWISTEVFPVDFITQGIAIESGDWEIRFRYAPVWLLPAVMASAAAWLMCLLYWSRISLRHFRRAK